MIYYNFQLANTLLVVFIPLIICATLNILLIVALRRNTMPMAMLNDCTAQKSLIIARNKTERKVANDNQANLIRTSKQMSKIQVTIMVTIIISSFIICNAPGAIITLLITINPNLFDQRASFSFFFRRLIEFFRASDSH